MSTHPVTPQSSGANMLCLPSSNRLGNCASVSGTAHRIPRPLLKVMSAPTALLSHPPRLLPPSEQRQDLSLTTT